MKTYRGLGNLMVLVDVDGDTAVLQPRHDLRNHSPDGFNWGYGGSGPAQLALALVADVLNDDARALRTYQPFKWRVVARWRQSIGWSITEDEILATVVALEAERARSGA